MGLGLGGLLFVSSSLCGVLGWTWAMHKARSRSGCCRRAAWLHDSGLQAWSATILWPSW